MQCMRTWHQTSSRLRDRLGPMNTLSLVWDKSRLVLAPAPWEWTLCRLHQIPQRYAFCKLEPSALPFGHLHGLGGSHFALVDPARFGVAEADSALETTFAIFQCVGPMIGVSHRLHRRSSKPMLGQAGIEECRRWTHCTAG